MSAESASTTGSVPVSPNKRIVEGRGAKVAHLLRPETVAVIGASDRENTPGYRFARHLLRSDVTTYLVNAKRDKILGVPAYRSLGDVPDPVDQAIILLAQPRVQTAVEECIARGVISIVIVTSGFGDASDEGRLYQARIAEDCRRNGVSLLGPNCYGYLNNVNNIAATGAAILTERPLKLGGVGIAAQSGGVGLAVLPWQLEALGTGVSYIVNVGNQADIDLADVVDFLAGSPVKVVTFLAEGVPDGRKLFEAVRLARQQGKQVIYLKVGRSEAGQRAASAHTGALAGEDRLFEGLMGAAGAMRFGSIEEVAFATHLLERAHGKQLGGRLALITISGGVAAQIVDCLGGYANLSLPALSKQTSERLASELSVEGGNANPVDLTAAAIADSLAFVDATRIVLDDPTIDVAIVALTVATGYDEVIYALDRLARDSGKPIVVLWLGGAVAGEGAGLLSRADCRLAWTRSERTLGAVLSTAVQSREGQSAPPAEAPALGEEVPPKMVVDEWRLKPWLEKRGMVMPTMVLLASAEELDGLADRLDDACLSFPLVAKGLVPGVMHKLQAGYLWLDVADFDQLAQRVRDFFSMAPGGSTLLLQERVRIRREFFFGYKADPIFGGIVIFGPGGTGVERETSLRYGLAPMTPEDARQMVSESLGANEVAPGLMQPLADSLSRISADLASSSFDEFELNPIALTEDGEILAVDALGVAAEAPPLQR